MPTPRHATTLTSTATALVTRQRQLNQKPDHPAPAAMRQQPASGAAQFRLFWGGQPTGAGWQTLPGALRLGCVVIICCQLHKQCLCFSGC
ncbi:hypothetical protein ACSF6V_01100 [Escherichia coli]|uniref:hypothetical protein n=1 Tax=Escherichia coli TaxID=562 RepID=UPI003EE8C324